MNQESSEKELVHKHEMIYFIFALLLSIVIIVSLLVSLVGIVFLVIGILLPLFAHALSMAQIRKNGVRLSERQLPEIYQKVKQLSQEMGLATIPDVYVMESSGILNAFATRFFGRNMVVLFSDIVDLIHADAEEELCYVIAHELAHIKRKHMTKQIVILPANWVPFVGEAYSRACEYTCDRMASFYTKNAEAAIRGLTILAVGKSLYRKVDRTEYLNQSASERGFFVWLVEKLSTHPPLPHRIQHIQLFFGQESLVEKSSKMVWVLTTVIGTLFALVFVGVLYATDIKEAASQLLSDLPYENQQSELIIGTAEGDLNKVKAELTAGADPNEQDTEGWTALMWAAQDNDIKMMELLLQNGADPMIQDLYEETALNKATTQGNIEAIRTLINAGADPNHAKNYGGVPLMDAISSKNIETVKVLLELGADINAEDSDGMTALMHAKKTGNKDIILLIKEKKNKN